MAEAVELVDRLVLSEADSAKLPLLPLGWPFDVARWPIAGQWDQRPTRTQRALALLRLSTVLRIRVEDDLDETALYRRIVAPLGLAWGETRAHYQIVCDALANAKCPNMGRAVALGTSEAEGPSGEEG